MSPEDTIDQQRVMTKQGVGALRGLLTFLVLLGSVALGSAPCAAHPESVTLQSALVWRTDGTGHFRLPDLEADTTYQLPQAIPTSGQIDTLTATWTFSGTVILELSADGGLHYTPAVNGVPLTSGFTGGNRLKWRAAIGPDSHLAEVQIVYTDRTGVRASFGEPKLSGFKFRKPIVVTGSPTGTLFHYQLQIAIGESEEAGAYDVHCRGHVRSDFADIRLTTADGQTVLPHYVENILGVSPGRVAIVWVQIPQLPSEGLTLYLYYSNPSAPDLSDGHAVFEFFDDFHGERLDPAVWEARAEGQGGATVSNGQLHLTSASILSKTFQLTNGVVEYLATTKTGQDDARLIIRSDRSSSHPDETNQVAYASAYGGAEHVIAVGNIVKANDPKPIAAETPHGYQVIARGASLSFQRFDAEFASVQATVAFDDATGLKTGALGLHSEGSASYDWIRVRQDAQPAPAVAEAAIPPPEEAMDLPVFTNTHIAPNGNLALANPLREGLYETGGIASEFLTRILIPSWKGQAAVDVSADGGASYHTHCFPDAHYYASKKAFTPGKRVKARVTMKVSDDAPTPELTSLTLDYASGDLFVVSPNGNERLAAGSTQEVTWSANGYEPTYPMKLDYSLDGGATYQRISDSTANSGTRVWILPEGVTSEEALVRVSDGYDPSVFDASDEAFAIVAPEALAKPQKPQEQTRQAAPAQQTPATLESTTDLAELLTKLGTDPHATPHELAVEITTSTAAEPDKEALAYHAGDIVLIRPAGIEWSEAEKNSFLILQANLTPQAIAVLMSPLEAPTGEKDEHGKPVMRLMGRRKFTLDLSRFDLKQKPEDKGKPAVLRHFKKPTDLESLVEERMTK